MDKRTCCTSNFTSGNSITFKLTSISFYLINRFNESDAQMEFDTTSNKKHVKHIMVCTLNWIVYCTIECNGQNLYFKNISGFVENCNVSIAAQNKIDRFNTFKIFEIWKVKFSMPFSISNNKFFKNPLLIKFFLFIALIF